MPVAHLGNVYLVVAGDIELLDFKCAFNSEIRERGSFIFH